MGNRAECPSCKSYSSTIYADLQNGKDCSICGCPHNLLFNWDEMQPILEKLATSKCNKELLNKLIIQEEEIAKLRTKLKKIEDIFCFTQVLEPLIEVKKFLEDSIE